jgi:hypothetical protein
MTVTGLPSNPSLTLGGAPLEFTVTLRNNSTAPYVNIAPHIAMDHCSCSSYSVAMAPDGSLELRQPDGSWRSVQYIAIGGGEDFFHVKQLDGITLKPGASASFTYRLSLKTPTPPTHYSNGTSTIQIDVVTVPQADFPGVIPPTKIPVDVIAS